MTGFAPDTDQKIYDSIRQEQHKAQSILAHRDFAPARDSFVSTVNILNKTNPLQLYDKNILQTVMAVTIRKHKRGCLLTVNNTQYADTLFMNDEMLLLRDAVIDILTQYIDTAVVTEQQTTNKLICPKCGQKTFTLHHKHWKCSNCEYTLKHYVRDDHVKK